MAYATNETCKTDACEGTPFFGETISPGFCDACHVDRVTAENILEQLDAFHERGDDDDYWSVRDDALSWADSHPAGAAILRSVLPV